MFLHDITATVSHEQGYKYINENRIQLHNSMEDVSWNGSSTNGSQIFILADGHGGAGAAEYFVRVLSEAVLELIESKTFDLALEKDRTELLLDLTNIFIQADNDYTLLKYDQFIEWSPEDTTLKKPDDDGCTLVLNIIMNGHLINANIGDSRTILMAQEGEESRIVFSSVDHNTTNPTKIVEIVQNGGNFVSQRGQILTVSQNDLNQDLSQLIHARIYRSPSLLSVNIGLSHRRTLNLTGSMGDIHFKLDPPVLSSVPDVSIMELDSNLEYILIAATDGVWDHLRSAPNLQRQNDTVKDLVSSALKGHYDDIITDKMTLPTPETSIDSCEKFDNTLILERLKYAANSLVKRENDDQTLDLFYDCLTRYDDATAQIIYMGPCQ